MKFTLDTTEIQAAEDYIKSIGQLPSDDQLKSLEPAGEGNMNLTLRATSVAGISVIVKQANPYVQKYPSIAAPLIRAEMEASFFRLSAKIPGVGAYLPKLLHFDGENHVQVIEDLGPGSDFTGYYIREDKPDVEIVAVLTAFLAALHKADLPAMANMDMRVLNHAHIFDLPFRKGIDLMGIQEGLFELADEIILDDGLLKQRTKSLGEVYLQARGPSLLHGDFFPGSWLHTPSGLRIIDPEFCFSGPPEFDLGVFMAHLRFCGWNPDEIREVMKSYGDFDKELAGGFMGTEILRRFFGVAQLPLNFSIEYKRKLALEAIEMIKI
jgi:5-methylthioribose kinase